MRVRHLSLLLLLAVSAGAAAEDLYGTVNRLRAGGGSCKPYSNMPGLRPQGALERAARDLAHGGDLKASLKGSGYRAARTRALSIKGETIGAQAATVLARPNYCAALQDAELTEAGIYLDAGQLWIVMAAPFAPNVDISVPDAGQRVLALVNRARASARRCGDRAFKAAPPVRWNGTLAEAARLHAQDMARHNYIAHEGRDGSNPAQRVERAGYRYRATGENIAAGMTTAQRAVEGWIKSPPHCANLMNPSFTDMGAAYAVNARSDMGIYWAQAFGTPR